MAPTMRLTPKEEALGKFASDFGAGSVGRGASIAGRRAPGVLKLIATITALLHEIFERDPDQGLLLALDLAAKPHQYAFEYQLQALADALEQRKIGITSRPVLSKELTKFEIVLPPFLRKNGSLLQFSPAALSTHLSPFLVQVEKLQEILDLASGRPSSSVVIRSITHNSPISVNMQGSSEALQIIRDEIVPWRQKHAKTLAEIVERKSQAEVDIKQAEATEIQARSFKSEAEAAKLLAEADEIRTRSQSLRLQNAKLEIEIQQQKIELALDVLQKIHPNATQVEKVEWMAKMLPTLEYFLTSDLEAKVLPEQQ